MTHAPTVKATRIDSRAPRTVFGRACYSYGIFPIGLVQKTALRVPHAKRMAFLPLLYYGELSPTWLLKNTEYCLQFSFRALLPAIMSQSRRWMFTYNFSGLAPSLINKLIDNKEKVAYCIWQHERVSHDHLQGYILFNRPLRRKAVVDILGPIHCEIATKPQEACIAYCSKEDSRIDGPFEFGTVVKPGSNKRKFIDAYERSPERLMIEDPMKYRRIEALTKNCHFRSKPLDGALDRPWQVALDICLLSAPDRRTIYWVYGPNGNDGKTHYAFKLSKAGWYYTKGGKKDNVIYQYMTNIDRHVVIDIPRESQDYIQYDILEMFKDRALISNKYEPVTIQSDTPVHVVVMANFLPDFNKISHDRIILLECDK